MTEGMTTEEIQERYRPLRIWKSLDMEKRTEMAQVFWTSDSVKDLEKAETAMRSLKSDPELSDIKCDKCGSPMAVLYNKRGKFLGCSKYPDCKNTM